MTSGRGSGGHGGRRRVKQAHEEEHENHERWAVSYADMMTVLVGLFIVMYAISNVDQVKYEQLRSSLAVGFGNEAPSILEGSNGAMSGVESFEIAPDLTAQSGIEPERPGGASIQNVGSDNDLSEEERNLAAAVAEYERLESIAGRISAALAKKDLRDRVRFRVTERGLVVGMVADDVFFAPDTAKLTTTARRVLDTAGPVIATLPEEISVEGHANVLPTKRYPTNWELSSDRATQVLRRLVERGHVQGTRIAAVGFGDARPLDGAKKSLAANRRVDLVILTDTPDDVRSLLPVVAEKRS